MSFSLFLWIGFFGSTSANFASPSGMVFIDHLTTKDYMDLASQDREERCAFSDELGTYMCEVISATPIATRIMMYEQMERMR